MPRFKFKGLLLNGTVVKGVREAATPQELEKALLAEQVALLSYAEQVTSGLFSKQLFSSSIKDHDLIAFFNYMAALLARGVPLAKALQLFSRQSTYGKLNAIIQAVCQQVTGGARLATVLREYPNVFSPVIVQLVEGGERTGNLDDVLAQVAIYLQDRAEFRRSIIRAGLFPLITLMFALFIFGMIFLFIIPQFEALFVSLEKPIPSSTQTVIWLSHVIRGWGGIIFLATLSAGFLGLRFFSKSRLWGPRREYFLLKLPGIGSCYRMAGLIFFLKSFLLFIKGGFTLKAAFERATLVMHRGLMKRQLLEVLSALSHGVSLTNALQNHCVAYIDENTVNLLAIGEQAGTMEPMLAQSISLLEERFKQRLHTAIMLLQPTLLLALGFFIALVLVITYVPIFSLATSLS